MSERDDRLRLRDPLPRIPGGGQPRIPPINTDVVGTIDTGHDRAVGPVTDRVPEITLKTAPPLALLPLRLEYRVVERRRPPIVVDTRGERPDVLTRFPTRRISARERDRTVGLRRSAISDITRKPVIGETLSLISQREIWFRWYPDEGFAEKGIAAATKDEEAALEAFDTASGAAAWFDIEKPAIAAAFADLAQAVGVERAVHLLRSRPALTGTPETRIGRIAALPARVVLLGVDDFGAVTRLGVGADIPQGTASAPSTIAYTPAAIETANWLNSFTTALQHGMGLKLTTEDTVKAALEARWIVAIGLHGGNAADELTTLVADGVANGTVAFLTQGTPTNATPGVSGESTANAHLIAAAQLERGAVDASPSNAADLFSAALGLDPAQVRKVINAADGAFEDARAMLRVIGPVLLDGALSMSVSLTDIDENDVIDIMAASICARGALPAIRAGRNPFGVLPVTRLRDLALHGDDETSPQARVHDFLRMYANIVREFQPRVADATVPVLRPDDPDAGEKLARILESYPVSRRVEVADAGGADPQALGCPYVTSTDHPAERYLSDLRLKPLSELPDPTANNRSWPLLYRLARVSLERSTVFLQIQATMAVETAGASRLTYHEFTRLPREEQARKSSFELYQRPVEHIAVARERYAHLTTQQLTFLRRLTRNFSDGLARLREIALRPDGPAQLETLLMETLDLFQHRVDAWATGLAYARLLDMRRTGTQGLKAGYWGVLSKLRPESTTGASDGYIQAPGSPQATTAALLRAAHLRYRDEGTFNIDLSSRRMRRALALLESISNGLSLPEVLGLRGERWLHDRHHDALIPRLRAMFPMTNPAPPENASGATTGTTKPITIRLFDGEAFLDSNLSGFTGAAKTIVQSLQAALSDELDALSDLVMCEAVHQRAMGNSGAANAWLQVLSGGHVPGDPAFPRTQRHGQGSSHRVSLLMKSASGGTGGAGTPREVAEPGLAAFAKDLVGPTASADVALTITHRAETEKTTTLSLGVQSDLGMQPIDLAIGGESEMRVRARHAALTRWLTDAGLAAELGVLPQAGLDAYVAERVSISLDLAAVKDMLEKAERLRGVAQRGRPLEPADLNAAAAPTSPLNETVDIQLVSAGTSELRVRAIALGARMDADRMAFDAAWRSFVTATREAQRVMSIPESDAVVTASIAAAEAARRALAQPLDAVSRYAEPDALRVFTTMDAVVDPGIMEESFALLSKRLVTRRTALDAAASAAASGTPATLDGARALRRGLVSALQGALDGAALMILPPVGNVAETKPLLDGPTTVSSAFGDWPRVREHVGRAQALAEDVTGLKAFAVSPKATADDVEEPDPRSEEVAPRSAHFGVFLGTPGLVNGPSFTGIVCDEWVEQRPSREQMSAVAVNYNSPQSEPPHAVLLCVPPDASIRAWDERNAAGMVFEAIQWMKVRALSTAHRVSPVAAFPNANQVPFNKNANPQRRIPVRKYHGILVDTIVDQNQFVLSDASASALGTAGVGVHEVSGRFTIKE